MLTVAKVVEPKVEVGEAANEVRELPPKPLTVVELELLAVVGKLAAAVDVGADASTGGTETGWPTPEHKDTTTLETACWSATSQACLTQGTTCSTRPDFWQWQAKSVSSEQPSEPRAEVRQFREHCGMLDSWALVMAPAPSTTAATATRIFGDDAERREG